MSTPIRWSAPKLEVVASSEDVDLSVEPQRHLPSVEELEAIEASARKEGYARGHAEGVASGQAEVRRIIAQMEGLLDAFTRPLARLDAEVGDALGDLAVRIAGSLLGQAYEADPELLARLVQEAIEQVNGEKRQLEVRLHPDDLAMLAPHLHTSDDVRLVADTTLSRGDLRLHADSVRIDGTLATRLKSALAAITQSEKP